MISMKKLRKTTDNTRPPFYLQNAPKIRFDNKTLAKAIKQGSIACKDFVPQKIFPKLTSEECKQFWSEKHLNPDDWSGLAVHILKIVLNPNIETTVDALDANGFRIDLQHQDATKFVQNLFKDKNEPDDVLIENTGLLPIIEDVTQSALTLTDVFGFNLLGFDSVVRQSVVSPTPSEFSPKEPDNVL